MWGLIIGLKPVGRFDSSSCTQENTILVCSTASYILILASPAAPPCFGLDCTWLLNMAILPIH